MSIKNAGVDKEAVLSYLKSLQTKICLGLETEDGSAKFVSDTWQKSSQETLSGGGDTRVLSAGKVFEKGGVGFSHVHGKKMPPSATANRPELSGRSFEAMGVSLVMHPHNPMVPISHMNVRFFIAEKAGEEPVWWFGGGYDLTPSYGFEEDCMHWHTTAKKACNKFSLDYYSEFKEWCDRYFYLKHRNEMRGIGGIFFDDFSRKNFSHSFEFMQTVGDSYLDAYLPIVEKRKDQSFTEKQKNFQCYRRGRYVEFNLVYDRGTLFGLQSGGRAESILMSMPPQAHWHYNFQVSADSEEERLTKYFLVPKNWLQD